MVCVPFPSNLHPANTVHVRNADQTTLFAHREQSMCRRGARSDKLVRYYGSYDEGTHHSCSMQGVPFPSRSFHPVPLTTTTVQLHAVAIGHTCRRRRRQPTQSQNMLHTFFCSSEPSNYSSRAHWSVKRFVINVQDFTQPHGVWEGVRTRKSTLMISWNPSEVWGSWYFFLKLAKASLGKSSRCSGLVCA